MLLLEEAGAETVSTALATLKIIRSGRL